NPTGAWFENVVINSPVKLQGVGPGGTYLDASGVQQTVLGSVINGNGFGGDTPTADAWRTLVAGLQWAGNQQIYEGAVVTVQARQNSFQAGFRVAVDGFIIEGGDQLGFPNNINQIGGGTTGQPAVVEVQGGGIYINGHAHFMQVTNNILRSNGGAYGGAIRVGTPNAVATPAADGRPAWDGFNWNDNILIARNQILANGGTNLAGAIGLFQGSDTYEVAWNHICGNFSAEYGGGISHYGYSPNSSIHNNRIYFNRSMDEGGGIMIAGELPADPNTLTIGAGQVSIYSNIIQSNLSNDDGGGLRFLMAQGTGLPGTAAPIFRVYNNIIVNNISTHEGGGVSLNDAPNVRFYNNTVMKNLTTATALTSNGAPAPAGLSTSRNSTLLQATLARTAPLYSQPLLFNNIFWDNRAGSFDLAGGVSGIGLPNDPNPIYTWDIGAADRGIQLPIWNSFLSAGADTRDYRDAGLPTPTVTVGVNPLVVSTYDTTVEVLPWRGNPRFVGATIVAQDVPPTLMGNYHLQAGSPAVNAGAFTRGGQTVATTDIDGDPRPTNATNPLNPAADVGADEIGPRNNFILVLPDSQVFDTLYLPFVRR
ncbi:MAG: hypothetical protein JNK29_05690, partial [Anaerolineales bacterium]|nr:hypothetical protein [Anaerolineales bacterium]